MRLNTLLDFIYAVSVALDAIRYMGKSKRNKKKRGETFSTRQMKRLEQDKKSGREQV